MNVAERFGAWTVEHFGGLAEWLLSLDPAVEGWVVLGGVIALAVGWNAFAGWINSFEMEIYDAEWMELEAWEATRDVS